MMSRPWDRLSRAMRFTTSPSPGSQDILPRMTPPHLEAPATRRMAASWPLGRWLDSLFLQCAIFASPMSRHARCTGRLGARWFLATVLILAAAAQPTLIVLPTAAVSLTARRDTPPPGAHAINHRLPLAAGTGSSILTIEQNEAEVRFAESIVFRLRASATSPIRQVILRFQAGPSSPVNRRLPDFVAGQRINVTFREDLVRGELPAGATVRWWWTLVDASGRHLDTAPASVVYLDERFEWAPFDGKGIRVWTYGSGRRVAPRIADQAQSILERLTSLVGSRPAMTIQVVGYTSAADMSRALVQHGEVYESRLTTLGARIAPDIIVLRVDGRRPLVEEILAHELSHLVLDASFAEPYVDAPLWLDEGLAMLAEGPLEAEEKRTLQAAIESDKLLSIRSLTSFPGRAELVPLAYAESHDVVSFLIDRYGRAKFQHFLRQLGDGRATVDEVLQAVYGRDQLALYQEYRAYHGLPPAATPPPGARPSLDRSSEPLGQSGCSSLLLLLPVLVIAGRSSRRTASPGTLHSRRVITPSARPAVRAARSERLSLSERVSSDATD